MEKLKNGHDIEQETEIQLESATVQVQSNSSKLEEISDVIQRTDRQFQQKQFILARKKEELAQSEIKILQFKNDLEFSQNNLKYVETEIVDVEYQNKKLRHEFELNKKELEEIELKKSAAQELKSTLLNESIKISKEIEKTKERINFLKISSNEKQANIESQVQSLKSELELLKIQESQTKQAIDINESEVFKVKSEYEKLNMNLGVLRNQIARLEKIQVISTRRLLEEREKKEQIREEYLGVSEVANGLISYVDGIKNEIADLEHEKSQMSDTVETKRIEISKCKSEEIELLSTRNQLKQQIKLLEKENVNISELHHEIFKKRQELEAEISELAKEELALSRQNIEQSKKQETLESKVDYLEGKHNEYLQRITGLQSEIDQCQRIIETAERRKSELIKIIEIQKPKIDDLISMKNELKIRQKDLIADNRKYKSEVKDYEDELLNLEQGLPSLQEKIKYLERKLEEVSTEHMSLLTKKGKLSAEFENGSALKGLLLKQIKEMRNKRDVLDDSNAELVMKLQQQDKLLSELKNKKEDIAQSCSNLVKEGKILANTLEKSRESNHGLNLMVDELVSKLHKIDKQNSKLKKEVQVQEDEAHYINKQIKVTQENIEYEKSRNINLNKLIEELVSKNEKISHDNQMLTIDHQNIREQSQEYREILTAEKNKLYEAEKVNSGLQKAIEKSTLCRDQQILMIQDLTNEYDVEIAKNKGFMQVNESMKLEIKKYEQMLDDFNVKNRRLREMQNELIKERNALMTSLNNITSALKTTEGNSSDIQENDHEVYEMLSMVKSLAVYSQDVKVETEDKIRYYTFTDIFESSQKIEKTLAPYLKELTRQSKFLYDYRINVKGDQSDLTIRVRPHNVVAKNSLSL
jgi:chromosome segregation ATPase